MVENLTNMGKKFDQFLSKNESKFTSEGLHEGIQQIKNKDQEQFLEAKRYYISTSLDIFEDESKTKVS